jgi:hypothetical protein
MKNIIVLVKLLIYMAQNVPTFLESSNRTQKWFICLLYIYCVNSKLLRHHFGPSLFLGWAIYEIPKPNRAFPSVDVISVIQMIFQIDNTLYLTQENKNRFINDIDYRG